MTWWRKQHGRYGVRYGEAMALPEQRPTYPARATEDLRDVRDSAIQQSERALALCRECHVPVPAHADWPART